MLNPVHLLSLHVRLFVCLELLSKSIGFHLQLLDSTLHVLVLVDLDVFFLLRLDALEDLELPLEFLNLCVLYSDFVLESHYFFLSLIADALCPHVQNDHFVHIDLLISIGQLFLYALYA